MVFSLQHEKANPEGAMVCFVYLADLAVRSQCPVSPKTVRPRVSLMVEVPEELHAALQSYVDTHPAWSQHRVFCAALSLFLMQDGSSQPDVNRIYLDALFDYVH